MSIKSIQLNTLFRLIIGLVLIFVVLLTFLAIRWSFGKTIAKQAEFKEIAELSTKLAPNDPQGYFALGVIEEKSLLPEDLKKAIENYQKAVSLSPSDFRLWLALGKARERSGDSQGAEKALRKSLELAPNYAEIHWVLGNFLIRQGNDEEGFAKIRRAVEQDEKYANPAVITAWQLFDGDVNQISQKIGDSVPIKAQLAPFLIKQKRFDEAFSFWNSIPDEEKRTIYKTKGEELFNQLVEVKSFRHALTVQTQISKPQDEKFLPENLFNGDFEKEIKNTKAILFDWKIADGLQPGIGPNSDQKRGGSRSLIMIFNSDTGKDLRTIQQTVVVEGGKNYKIEGVYRADLKTLATVKVEVLDATDNKVLAFAEASASAKDWSLITADFTVPTATQAVIIRLGNVSCKQALCPISGKIWFDDISLK